MSATITEPNTSIIQISGAYKDFTSGTGSTTSVINFSSGDAPASADAGRFLMWRPNTSDTKTWEIRYIESATTTSVTVGDGGFSSAPPSGAEFRMSSNLGDIHSTIGDETKLSKNDTHYEFVDREWKLTGGAFLADVDKSIGMTNKDTGGWSPSAFQVGESCAVQFGRLLGGEANDSVETTQGCRLALRCTVKQKLIFGVKADGSSTTSNQILGGILNFYGCQIEASHTSHPMFIRAGGPLRMIGTISDGDIGGRFYNEASEFVDCRFSGNSDGGHAWSSAVTPTRDIDNVFFFGNDTATKSLGNYDVTFKNCRFANSNSTIIEAEASSGLNFKFIDCTTFADNKISANRGNYKQGKSINYEITDSSGVGLSDVLVAVYDKNGLVQTGIQTSSSGTVSEIQAIFFNKPHNNVASNLSPFDIRIRKYGYTYLGFSSAVSDTIKQELRLVVNSELDSTEEEASAITGINLNFSTSTLTITEDTNAQKLYDYYQYQLAQSSNMQYAESFTKTGTAFDLDNWDLVVDGCEYTGDMTTSETITTQNGGSIVGSATDKNGTSILLPWSVSNVEATATIQLYNMTKDAEVVNKVAGGTLGTKVSESGTYTTAQIEAGDNIRLRITCQAGAGAFLPYEAFSVASASGIAFIADQKADEVYNGNGIDGSAVTTLTADYPNVQIDISDGDGFADSRELYAFAVYQSTTATGIDKWFNAITAIDSVNYRINTANADIKLQNTGSVPLVITGARIYRDDGTSVLFAEDGDKPMVQDTGELVQYISPQLDTAMNSNAKLDGVSKNTKLIPALL